MKRILTLLAGIVGTVFQAIWSLLMLIGIAAIFEILSGADVEGTGLLAIIALLEIALGVVALVLNAVSITGFSCTAEKYSKKKGLIITATVFNFLLALLLLISTFSSPNAINILVMIASVVAGVLYIVDMCLEKKRLANVQPAAEQTTQENVEQQENSSTNE